jgi:hypothetical protein
MSIARKDQINPMLGKHHSEETKNKISLANRNKIVPEETRKKISVANKGKKCSDECRHKLSLALKGKTTWIKGKHHSNETKNKISSKMMQRIINNNGINLALKNYKHGWFYSEKNHCDIYYDSSWEAQSYQILEQMSEVKYYEICKFSIDYTFKDNIHKYIPDILITYQDSKQEIIEVKPLCFINDKRNQAKFIVAKEYCEQNNIDFNIWTEKQLTILSKEG